jgi:L-asparaginase
MPDRRRVLILNTGGTVGMARGSEGWAPEPGRLGREMAAIPAFQSLEMPQYEVRELEPLLDSSEVGPEDWVRIARAVRHDYEGYDGFVVVHGTDTMAYSASALAFMLEGLEKTVIFTGSQIPLCQPRNDAQANLIGSLLLAAEYRIPEVALYFDARLFRGCRAVKVKCDRFDAFDSPNLPPLAVAGSRFQINRPLIRWPDRLRRSRLVVHEALDPEVGVLWLFPGLRAAVLNNFLQPPLKGVVLRAFGVGNGPAHDPEFLAALADATARGVVIVDCTQCLSGSVNLADYATGAALARAGVVSGYDMTVEAALTKLMHLFGIGLDPDEVRDAVQQDLRGELSMVTPG